MDWNIITEVSEEQRCSFVSERYSNILNRYWLIYKDECQGPEYIRSMFFSICERDLELRKSLIFFVMERRQSTNEYPITAEEILQFLSHIKNYFECIGNQTIDYL